MNSRSKGCRGERAWRDWLREQGYLKAYRGAQFCGLRSNADVVCPETPLIHYEVKRGERLDVYAAKAEAEGRAMDWKRAIAYAFEMAAK
jgi:hypothetical protein